MSNEITQQQIMALKQKAEMKKMELVRAKTQLENAEEQVRISVEKLAKLGVTPDTAADVVATLEAAIETSYNDLQNILRDVEAKQAEIQAGRI